MESSPTGFDRIRQSEVVAQVKRESTEDRMAGAGDFPVDMSVRENRPDPAQAHRYMPVNVTMDATMTNRYFSNIYNSDIIHPQNALNPHFHDLSHQADAHLHHLSPPSHLPQQRQQQQLQQQKTSPPQMRPSHHSPLSVASSHTPETPTVPTFKFKDSSGKLAVMDILTTDSDMDSSLDLLPISGHQRAKREFVPENKKDEGYWNKRLKNNDSARRSRVKRKALEKIMESRLMDLQKENIELKHEMAALKRRFGIPESESVLPTALGLQSVGVTGTSQDMSSTSEFSRDEELEQQSAGSDDSHSHDDSRSFNVGSMLALSHSLGPTGRDRADSFGSGTSSGGRSSRPDSRSSQPGSNSEGVVRTDKSGALDLTSDHSNRSTPARDSLTPESCNDLKSRSSSSLGGLDTLNEEKKGGAHMRGFPLKCRWKREMQSSSTSSATSLSSSPLASASSE